MSDRITLENYHAAQAYARHHHTLPTEAALRQWLSNNKVSIPGRSDTFVEFRPAMLTLLSYHADGIPLPPPLLRDRMKRPTRRARGANRKTRGAKRGTRR